MFEDVRYGGLSVTQTSAWDPQRPGVVARVDWVRPLAPRYAAASLRRALTGRLAGRTLRVLSPEDFVLFKILSTREIDLVDAAGVLKRNAERMDLSLIDSNARSLARAVRHHDVRGRWASVKARASAASRSVP
jgi:hypothetical protein